MPNLIQLRRDTAANWAAVNPVLAQGEMGVDLTNKGLKIGDGSTAWSSLPYVSLGDMTKAVYDTNGDGVINVTSIPTGISASNIGDGSVSNTEFQYLDGVTSAIQTQLNAKQASLGFTAENVSNKDTDGTLASNSDTKYPSQKAVKTYADGKVAANSAISGATKTKITYDSKGLVTAGANLTEVIGIACSDESTALTAGNSKVVFRMPYAFTLTGVRASLSTAQTSGNIFTVDINEAGTSILSTKLTIDNTEKTSVTAATAAVISDTAIADDAEITVDIDQIGDGTAKGLKVYLIGYQ